MSTHEIIICYRKHLFGDQIYEILITDKEMHLINPKKPNTPKYVLPLNWYTQISWLCNKEYAFGFITKNKKFKWFHSNKKDILFLKKHLSKFVSFTNVQDFYEATEHIANGSNSQVYQVIRKYDKNDNFITKCITKDAIEHQPEKLNGLFEELNVLKQLNHPNLPLFEEFYVGDGTYYIVLEYCRGQSLNSYIKELKHQLNVKIIQNILSELLQALVYLHQLNIIHRDIKPENIILNIKDKGIDVKIVDFGLAVQIQPGKELKKCGTPGFVAPEIINLHHGKYGVESDVFSLGCVFYKLLLRKDLFQGETQNEILSANRKCQFNLSTLSLIRIPQTAQSLLAEMLQEDPRLRVKAREALHHSFFRENFRISIRNIPLSFNNLNNSVQLSYHTQTSQFKQYPTIMDDEFYVDYFSSELPPISQIPILDLQKDREKDREKDISNSQSTDSKQLDTNKFLFRKTSKSTG